MLLFEDDVRAVALLDADTSKPRLFRLRQDGGMPPHDLANMYNTNNTHNHFTVECFMSIYSQI
jgi:hypothetical protein